MKKSQLKVEEIVKEILIKNPKTRDDDFELIAEYYHQLCPEISNMKFSYVFLEHKDLGLPSFESITRARRKIQAKHQELANEKIKQKRKHLENEYREFYAKYEEWKGIENYE